MQSFSTALFVPQPGVHFTEAKTLISDQNSKTRLQNTVHFWSFETVSWNWNFTSLNIRLLISTWATSVLLNPRVNVLDLQPAFRDESWLDLSHFFSRNFKVFKTLFVETVGRLLCQNFRSPQSTKSKAKLAKRWLL